MNNTLIDNLSYSYYGNGNRLKSVADASGNTAGYVPNSGQYLYDANANMTYDPSKKITISYNPLNLPRLVEFDNSDFIEYTYTATGTKLRKTVTSWKTTAGGTTDYSGQFLYQDNELSCIFTPVGRIVPMQYNDETFWKHEYNLKDHLGNTRIVFAAHPHGQPEVMQQTSYYPFGMTLQQQNFGGALNPPNKLLYNGKELQDDELAGVSLDWYDYGARFYDTALGRWHVLDNLADKYSFISPYAYVLNNPLIFIDPDGQDVEIVIGKPYTKNGKEHPYGHTAIRVHGKGYDYVYDFGRYGKTWGIMDYKGEGILNLYNDGQKYLQNEQKFRESVGYNLSTTKEKDQKIIDYFQNLTQEGEKYGSGAVPGGGGTAYKLEDDYNALNNNCVTKSAEGLEQIGENHIGNENKPNDLLKDFESNYKEMGFTKRTEYLEGGGTKVTYEKKPLPNPPKKQHENQY